ncbi:hypothetical protein M8494_15560 [Serratia ureilytica]
MALVPVPHGNDHSFTGALQHEAAVGLRTSPNSSIWSYRLPSSPWNAWPVPPVRRTAQGTRSTPPDFVYRWTTATADQKNQLPPCDVTGHRPVTRHLAAPGGGNDKPPRSLP